MRPPARARLFYFSRAVKKGILTMPDNLIKLPVHFVWATWNRMPLITEEIEAELYRYIRGVCEKLDCPVLAVGGMSNHIHLLVAYHATITLAEIMGAVKGSSSRFVNTELRPGEFFKWQGSYAAFGVSPHDKRMDINYILNQKQHHADGTIWPNAERTCADPPDADTENE
jgi:putative transposase